MRYSSPPWIGLCRSGPSGPCTGRSPSTRLSIYPSAGRSRRRSPWRCCAPRAALVGFVPALRHLAKRGAGVADAGLSRDTSAPAASSASALLRRRGAADSRSSDQSLPPASRLSACIAMSLVALIASAFPQVPSRPAGADWRASGFPADPGDDLYLPSRNRQRPQHRDGESGIDRRPVSVVLWWRLRSHAQPDGAREQCRGVRQCIRRLPGEHQGPVLRAVLHLSGLR